MAQAERQAQMRNEKAETDRKAKRQRGIQTEGGSERFTKRDTSSVKQEGREREDGGRHVHAGEGGRAGGWR